jgi:hypothetical protein
MSQSGFSRVPTGILPPSVPTSFVTNSGTAVPALGILNVLGTTSVAGSIPFEFTGSGNTVTGVIQRSQAIASTDSTKIGLSSFNSAQFTVDANGFVSTINNGITNVQTAHATPQFALTGTTETVDFGITNLLLGSSGSSITTANENCGYGQNAGNALTSGEFNCFFGAGSGETISTGSANSFFGNLAGAAVSSGVLENNGFGAGSLENCTGSYNIAIGYNSGSNYGANSSNICLGNIGNSSDQNTIRLGTQGTGNGQQNKNIQAGITGVTAVGSPLAISSTGQLSDLGFGTATQVLTSNGPGVSPTWKAGGGGFTPVNFSAKLSGNIGGITGDGTPYLIAYDTVTFDSASGFSTGSHLYTIPTTGIYQFNCTWFVYTSSGISTSTIFLGYLLINGSTNIRLGDASPNSLGLTTNSEFMQGGTYLYNATAGDTIGMYINLSGGTKNIGVAGGSESCLFSGFRVG